MAKQFGVSDEALAGLNDPERFPFPPEEGVALRFADAMTDDPAGVSDELFAELRRHWSEPQIVEIACVIGLFNYFNRFNNALHMEITLTDPEVLLHRVRKAAEEHAGVSELCDRTAEILAQGRRYVLVGIYQRQGEMMVLRAYRGPAPPHSSFRLGEGNAAVAGRTGATPSELAVPVRDPSGIHGVIDVESDRPAGFGEEDRALVEAVAAILAPALAGPAA
ncbi:MAG: hypothetical protein DMF50_07430 [Acidobacteria bacterium]|nr:MAG: hypothetical protein DMF50_07430 [Acidobacteriota bacterium]